MAVKGLTQKSFTARSRDLVHNLNVQSWPFVSVEEFLNVAKLAGLEADYGGCAMSLEQWAYVGEIAAAIAVVVSLIYVARQLGQNNELLQAQARQNRFDLRVRDFLLPVNDQALADTLVKCRNDETLTDRDNFILGRYAGYILLAWQHVYMESQRGLIEESRLPTEGWRSQYTGERSLLTGYWPRLADFWEANKNVFDPEFVSWFEEKVVNG